MKLIVIISFTHVIIPIYNQYEKLTNELLYILQFMPCLWNTVYALLLFQFSVKTGHASTGQVLHGSSDQAWQLWVRDFMANGAKTPKQEKGGGKRHLHSPDEHTHLLSKFSVCEKVMRNNIWSEQKSFPQHFSKNDTLYYFRKGIFWNQQAYVEFWSQLDAQRKSERPMQCSKHS